LFEPDRRNAKRQMCCPKKACRAALKAARQRRWLEQPRNRDYFRGAEHLERVRAWRRGWRPMRYKTLMAGKPLMPLKIPAPRQRVRYKTPCACKARF
jgi:hypothetical protein